MITRVVIVISRVLSTQQLDWPDCGSVLVTGRRSTMTVPVVARQPTVFLVASAI